MVLLGQGLADPIPTPRLPLLSLPRTRQLPPLAPDSPSRPGGGTECRGATWVWAPSPLPLSRTRQARILVHICQSGRWGFPERLVLWEKRSPGSLSFGREKRRTGVGQGGRAAPPPVAWRSPSRPRYAAAEGAPAGLSPAPRYPNGWKWNFPQGGRAPIQGTHNGVPEDHASQLFVRSPPSPGWWPLLRRRPGAAFRPKGGKGSLAAATVTPLLCATALREVEGLCA